MVRVEIQGGGGLHAAVFEAWLRPGLLDPAEPVHHLEPVDYWLEQFNQVLIPLAHSGGRQTPLDWIRLLGLVAEISTAWQDAVTDPEAAWLERARNSLHRLPQERRSTRNKTLETFGMSERTFRRRFKALAGMTPGQYATQHRIGQARRSLLESDAKVVEIAQAFGFANEFHFSRRFKKVTGLSPRAYREMHQCR